MCLALPNSYAQGAEVIAWTRMVIHYVLPRSGRKRCFLAWKVRRIHASPRLVSGIEISKTPPSADEAGGVFLLQVEKVGRFV
jgi:hypothetical protein